MKLRYMVKYALRGRIPAYRHGVAVAGRNPATSLSVSGSRVRALACIT